MMACGGRSRACAVWQGSRGGDRPRKPSGARAIPSDTAFIRHVSGLLFRNSTRLDSGRLINLFAETMRDWPIGRLVVWVRYTRQAPFSGTCYDSQGRIFVNVGRGVQYPYDLPTHVARTVTTSQYWIKPIHTLRVADAYQLALFVYLHECYHWLIRRAKRNRRQKESMCDRFAVRTLVDRFGCAVRDESGRDVERESWDFQNLERFVAGAKGSARPAVKRARPAASIAPASDGNQFLLFES